MSKTIIGLLCFITLVTQTVSGQNSNPLFDHLNFGSYQVGYRLIKAYDKVRSPLKEQLTLPEDQQVGRAVPIYFWYPATQERDGSNMTFKDYLNEWAFAWDFNLEDNKIKAAAKQRFVEYHFDLPETKVEAYFGMDIQTLAKRDVASAQGKFPLVVFSHGSVDRWWIWGELLASHGIAVIGTPNSGAHQKRHEMGISGLEAQIRDAEFAVSVVNDFDFIDSKSTIAAGSSYGSLTAIGLASRNDNVKGVISLDGIIADQNEGELLQQTPYMDYQLFTTPILHMNSGFNFSSNYIWMDQMKYADQYRMKFSDLRHSDYHFQGMADLFGVTWEGTELKNSVEGFSWITKYTLAFIKGVTGNESQLEFLKLSPQENGVPGDMMETDFIKGLEEAYSATQILEIANNQGFEVIKSTYERVKQANAQPFSHSTFFDVGIMLHRSGLIEEEKIWFGYYLESYPKSIEAMYRLARLEALTGNEELAKTKLLEAKNSLNNDPDLSNNRRIYLLSRIEHF